METSELLYTVKPLKNCSTFQQKENFANNLSQEGIFIDRVKINKQKDYTLLREQKDG